MKDAVSNGDWKKQKDRWGTQTEVNVLLVGTVSFQLLSHEVKILFIKVPATK